MQTRHSQKVLTTDDLIRAIRRHLEEYKEANPGRVPTCIRLGTEYYDQVQSRAHAMGLSVIPKMDGVPVNLNRSNIRTISINGMGRKAAEKAGLVVGWVDSLANHPREGFAQ